MFLTEFEELSERSHKAWISFLEGTEPFLTLYVICENGKFTIQLHHWHGQGDMIANREVEGEDLTWEDAQDEARMLAYEFLAEDICSL